MESQTKRDKTSQGSKNDPDRKQPQRNPNQPGGDPYRNKDKQKQDHNK